MKKINIKGPIVANSSKIFYKWLGWDCCCASDVQTALEEADGEDIVLEINSNGGIATSGFEIYTLLKEYPGNVEAHVICAMSAATIIASAADKVLVSDACIYMIHNTQSYAEGDYRDMQMEADALREFNESIINVYTRKTGMSREKLQELMDNDTYMSAEKAIELGFADDYMFGNPDEKNNPQIVAVNASIPVITDDKAKEFMSLVSGTAYDVSIQELVNKLCKDTGDSVSDSDTGESGSDNISNNGKEGNTMTLEEFLKENPGEQAAVDAMVASAKEDGVQEERKRIKELDDIAKSVTQEALNNAKYGEKTMDAKELSFQVMKDDSLKAASYMKDAVEDSKESGVKDVGVGSCKEDEEIDEAAEAAAYVNKLKGKGVK